MKTILVDAVYGLIYPEEGIFKGMLELLEEYPNPKIILTGANQEQRQKFGLENLPYDLFTLEHNPEKTDPEYFQRLLTSHNLKADEVVYFEHDPEAVKSAQSLGITCYFYDSEKRDLEALRSWLEKNV